jgi:hypothetical protein
LVLPAVPATPPVGEEPAKAEPPLFGDPPDERPEPPVALLAELPPPASALPFEFEQEADDESSRAVATAHGTSDVRRRRSFTRPTPAS